MGKVFLIGSNSIFNVGKKKYILLLVISTSLFLTVRLFCGVFEHDEFNEDIYFIKHRPIWKWRFYSTIGMSDLDTSNLSSEQKREQKLFDEFVAKRMNR